MPITVRAAFASLMMTASLAAYAAAPASPASPAPTALERLQHAARVSQDLFARAAAVSPAALERLAIRPHDGPDGTAGDRMRFPREQDLVPYARARRWSLAFVDFWNTEEVIREVRTVRAEPWPLPADAPALRALLSHGDPTVRALAAEALASLALPEDVTRFAALLKDDAAAPPALVGNMPRLAEGFPQERTGPDRVVYACAFHPRTVSAYASEALHALTGNRFDGTDWGPRGPVLIVFDDWIKTHERGMDSFWYWQRRFDRDAHPPERSSDLLAVPGAKTAEERTAALHRATLAAIRTRPADTQLKLFLLGGALNSGVRPENPFDPAFTPAEVTLTLSKDRFFELLAKKNLWPDVDYNDELYLRLPARLVFLAPALLPREDWAAIRAAMADIPLRPATKAIFLSHLCTPSAGAVDQPGTREQALHAAFAGLDPGAALDIFGCEDLMREMLRTNPAAHWPQLVAGFYAETQESAVPTFRQALLTELGTEPRTPQKRGWLLKLINDPRNDRLFTQPSTTFASDGYRKAAARAVNAYAGRPLVPDELVSRMVDASAALAEFRRLAATLATPE
jgi:hypothetical protein